MATDSETSLRASRGYVKGAITRLHSFVSNESELEESTLQALTTRKERLLTAFREYEGFNMRILSMRPDDDEDVAAVEDKYLYTLTVLNEVISRKTYSVEDSKGHVSTIARSKTKLPAIQMSIFSGNYVEYVAFQSLFTSLIHSDLTLDNVQKLYYLRSYLKNEPYDLIKNLPLTASSYDQARQLLEERYNNRYRIVNEHIGQLLDLPALVKSTPENIRYFVASLKQTLAALQNLDMKVETWDPIIVCILNRKLDTYTARSYQMEKDTAEEHSVKHFIEYLEKRALALENAAPSTAMPSNKAKGLSVNVAAAGEKVVTCHTYTFKLITSVERYKFCKDNKLCLICLNRHNGKCKFHFKCDLCKKAHNSLVHHDECDEVPVSLLSKGHDSNVLLPTVKVKLFTKDKKTIIVKAILDTGSQASLATSKLIQQLGLTPIPNNTNIIGVGNAQNNTRYCIPLNIHSVNSSFNMTANFYVVEKITCKHPQTKLDIRQLKLPPNIVLADDQFDVPSEINLLMGADIFFHAIMPNVPEQPRSRNLHRPLPSQGDITPCIINTRFGHIIGGSMLEYQQASKQVTSLLCIKCDPEINDNIKLFWEAESIPQTFSENQSEQELAETIFQNSVELIDNRFQVNLPLKVEDNEIHNYLDLSEIKEAKQQLQSLLQKGSFETHKWSANDPEILSDIPISKQHFDELELQKDNYSIKVLGLNLDVKNDWFNITCPETIDIKSVTKKSILSCIAKSYDPLGFVCPIIVKAKIIMQKLWAEGISWDASPSDHVKEEWLFFIDGLKAMEPIHINRNIPIPLGSKAVQLIGFADASSKIGYGCCVYLRTVDSDCNVRMFILCAKSRINSFSKPITIPRLELNAALLLSSLVRRTYETLQLKLSIDNVYLFTDSKIVLSWLNTDIFNLQAYVANRVKVITEKTVQFQWNYVNTKENPADLISRGIDPKELPSCSLWWDGPDFLKDNRYNFTNKASLPIDLPELKNSGAAINSSKIKCNYLTTKELQQSLQNIIKQEQSIHFSKEIKSLTESKDVEGILKPLHIFLDKHGLIRFRSKWQKSYPNVTVGMLVILKDPNNPPLHWPMARISKVFPGRDGKVRAFEVVTPNGKTYKRSLSGICILPINDA
ncbi:uncharacterized protein LOC113513303 [Galleria mellonella]|uniref:Uncharacterized protein LOC113513303 n=1 Tax=Galleria mellonella TaxID=7137 RepID=A0ABM3MJY3_GALME|nr:uncharacterized protein LOC113513303 [Galleria mellonella]